MTEKQHKEIGEIIKNARLERGLTLIQAAVKSDVSAQTYCSLEKGVPCTNETLLKVCNALGLTLSIVKS
jgi:transcriptional regulator with XRE-family HTH domain